ncbi:Polycomb group RING finger protein, putative [Pediculus humanus corporis]|uniref:Polycomb group RING finger protein, putative n=1 Tax=Pediculus humanus subsp. corporis TaxID=121224 RepID=E0VYM5_PEDHC|nr:Polycomb group RING finger protein, putative [Pediculus humanus corporis]EEB18481.1 Polycomb group RING finger protein, putative [Pediculus humanus corporis]
MERRIKLKTLNSHITCKICRGYLIDATTVTECLHTFCKSCLVKHLEENNTCPTCNIVIHQSHPLQYISFDRTMQDIVYKLVPHLQENEMKQEREFYRLRGLPCPKDVPVAGSDLEEKSIMDAHAESDYHRHEEQVHLEMVIGENMKSLPRKFIRCSSQATITHIKKYIAKKVWSPEKYSNIDILCNGELLGKDHTLKFVYVTRWRLKDPPMKLEYRRTIDI